MDAFAHDEHASQNDETGEDQRDNLRRALERADSCNSAPGPRGNLHRRRLDSFGLYHTGALLGCDLVGHPRSIGVGLPVQLEVRPIAERFPVAAPNKSPNSEYRSKDKPTPPLPDRILLSFEQDYPLLLHPWKSAVCQIKVQLS